jgi:hypothetical protein
MEGLANPLLEDSSGELFAKDDKLAATAQGAFKRASR